MLFGSLQTIPSWEGMVNMLEGRDAIERDHEQMKKWTKRNLVKFTEDKWKVLRL